jgi:hypothetical protein
MASNEGGSPLIHLFCLMGNLGGSSLSGPLSQLDHVQGGAVRVLEIRGLSYVILTNPAAELGTFLPHSCDGIFARDEQLGAGFFSVEPNGLSVVEGSPRVLLGIC